MVDSESTNPYNLKSNLSRSGILVSEKSFDTAEKSILLPLSTLLLGFFGNTPAVWTFVINNANIDTGAKESSYNKQCKV